MIIPKSNYYLDKLGLFFIACTIIDKNFYLLGIFTFTLLSLIRLRFIRISDVDIKNSILCLFGLLVIYFMIRMIFLDVIFESELAIFRNYFGWIFFLLIFSFAFNKIKSEGQADKYFFHLIDLIFMLIVIFHVIEVLFPNLIFIQNIYAVERFDQVYGLTARPGSTASILACILVIYVYCKKYCYEFKFSGYIIRMMVGLVNLYMLGSGTGFLILLLGLMLFSIREKKLLTGFKMALIMFFATLIAIGLMDITMEVMAKNPMEFAGFKKLNSEYIAFLWDAKLDLVDVYRLTTISFIVGSSPAIPEFGSDFGLGLFIYYFGYIGLLFFLLMVIRLTRGVSFSFLIPILVSNFHYPTTTTAIGSLFFGLIMAWGLKKSAYAKKYESTIVRRKMSDPPQTATCACT